MKKLLTILFIAISVSSSAQVLCGTAGEGGTVTLTAPVNNVFTSIEFASYGTPNGSCGSFTLGPCNASNSVALATATFIGHQSASIGANNGVFGDPCGGTVKRLYIQARYTSTLPLTLISFSAQQLASGAVQLDWSSANEVNTKEIVVERSIDGIAFEPIGTVAAGSNASNQYRFVDPLTIANKPVFFYRLKMVDRDDKFTYSSVVRIDYAATTLNLKMYPNPATGVITINSAKKQNAIVLNSMGQTMRTILLIEGSQTLSTAGWPAGSYCIKTEAGVYKFMKR